MTKNTESASVYFTHTQKFDSSGMAFWSQTPQLIVLRVSDKKKNVLIKLAPVCWRGNF